MTTLMESLKAQIGRANIRCKSWVRFGCNPTGYLFFCLIVIAFTVNAQTPKKSVAWEFIGKFDDGTAQYIDMKSLKRERGYIRVLTLTDHQTPEWWAESKKIFSTASEQYIDCKRKRFAILSGSGYERRMAGCKPKEAYSIPFLESEFKSISTLGSAAGEMSSEVGNLYALVCQ